jgi:glycosyltransferase involved in cell wall biosynthesis
MPLHRRPKVLLLIPHLGGGGAERVMALLARGLSPEKYELHLGLILREGMDADSLPSWVTVHRLNASRVRSTAMPLLSLVRTLRPQLILSGIFHLSFLVLLLRPFFPRGTRILIRQNGTASAALAFGNLPSWTRLFYRWLYPRADCILCQTAAMANDLRAVFRIPAERLVVLENPVDFEEVRRALEAEQLEWKGPGPHLLAVSRQSKEKGLDLLLEALAIVRKKFPQAHLLVAGSGPEEAALQALSLRLNLDSAVRFAGHLARPAKCFPGASVFVLPSRHEGLPNALLEAAVAGLPIVASPASAGLIELLRDQPGVWLAGDVSSPALAAALLEALTQLSPGERFPHPFIEPFRMDRAIAAYERVIDGFLPGSTEGNSRQLQ